MLALSACTPAEDKVAAAPAARTGFGAKSWKPPPKPADCDLDRGSGLVADANDVTFGCAGDTVLARPDRPRLPAGPGALHDVLTPRRAGPDFLSYPAPKVDVMAGWQEIENEAAEFAAKVKERFESGTNKTLATLRRDGSPRISGTEAAFRDGELMVGMMPGSMKLRDVRRDPRIAMHSPTIEPPEGSPQDWPGDAKVAGVAVEIPAPEGSPVADAGHFRIDITEVVLTYVGDPADHLVIESWHAGRGHRRQTRT